jgi:phosphopantetheinyl transferase (holo-ACP synthase)
MGRVGLDLQAYRTFEPIESAFSFFSTAEQQAILNSTQPQQTLIHYWAKKEALIKAGNGRMFDEAAQTNATLQNCIWKDVAYYWSPIATDFEGAIWAASDFEPQKIIVKKCRSI